MNKQLKERTLLYKLIARLSRLCQGLDRELDNRLGKLRVQLDNNVEIASLDSELDKLNNLLHQQLSYRDDNAQALLDAIEQFGSTLQQMKGLKPQLRRDLRAFMQDDEAYGGFEHQQRLIKLFEYYQQTMVHKESLAQSCLTPDEHKQHKRLCDDLQQVIAELELNQGRSESLTALREQLLDGVSVQALPALCMAAIQLIVEGLKTERHSSQTFLTRLDERLTTFLSSFSQTVADSKDLSHQRLSINQALKEGFADLKSDLSGSQELDDLKVSIAGHLSAITGYFSEKECLERRENKLLEKLNAMERRISLMKDETAEYKKRLSIQQEKIYLDALTGIPNRGALDERMEQEYKRWLRYKQPLAIAVVDIDHFKRINDNYGHMAGDKALKVIASVLQRSMRETDFIARFGGEEFVILLPSTRLDKLHKPLDQLRKKIKQLPFKFKGSQVAISISIGATLLKEGDQLADAFERADQALYTAKSAGRDVIKLIS